MLLFRIRFTISDALYHALSDFRFEYKTINVGIPILVHDGYIETSYKEDTNDDTNDQIKL